MRSALIFLILTNLIFGAKVFAKEMFDLNKEKKESAKYLERMSKEPDAEVIEKGVIFRPIFLSKSERYPELRSTIKATYLLTDRKGHPLDENLSTDVVIDGKLEEFIECWKIAVQQMPAGSQAKVSCPSETAYGDKGAGGVIKPGAALTFHLILLDFE